MLIITPRIDLDGERWISEKEGLPKGLKLKVASIENDQFRSRNALVRRHIDKLDAVYNVGTKDFSLADVGDIDSVDDLLIENCARFLLLDWQGVGERIEGKEQAVAYSPENGVLLLKQRPHLYWKILATAGEIAAGKKEQVAASVGKSSKRRSGSVNSAASQKKRPTGAEKS